VNKESWPEFPLWWLEESKRNMTGLQDIAAHLHEKTEGSRGGSPGFVGTANDMERQLIERMSALAQQVYVLTSVTQALLRIVAEDHERRSTRTRRMFGRIRDAWKRFWLAIEQNMVYRIMAIVGTLFGVAAALWGLIHHFRLH